jgi:hypothetical protein
MLLFRPTTTTRRSETSSGEGVGAKVEAASSRRQRQVARYSEDI